MRDGLLVTGLASRCGREAFLRQWMAVLGQGGCCPGAGDGVLGEGGRVSWGRARDLGGGASHL
jgi:hypothetical protein